MVARPKTTPKPILLSRKENPYYRKKKGPCNRLWIFFLCFCLFFFLFFKDFLLAGIVRREHSSAISRKHIYTSFTICTKLVLLGLYRKLSFKNTCNLTITAYRIFFSLGAICRWWQYLDSELTLYKDGTESTFFPRFRQLFENLFHSFVSHEKRCFVTNDVKPWMDRRYRNPISGLTWMESKLN